MITDHSQRARIVDFMEADAPTRSRDLATIGVAATVISRKAGYSPCKGKVSTVAQ